MRFVYTIGIVFLAFLMQVQAIAQTQTPQVSLKFREDKIFILNEEKVAFEVDVFLGTADHPVQNIYALSFEIEFPADLIISDSTKFTYHAASFLGNENQVSVLQKSQLLLGKGRLDITLGRNDGKNVSGFGKIGTYRFITMGDIIGSRAGDDGEVIFDVNMLRIKAVNNEGNELPIEINEEGSSVIIQLDRLANNLRLNEHRVDIFPIPANDVLYVSLQNLQGQQIELFNAFGQRVHVAPIRTNYIQLQTSNYQPGIYFVKVHAEEGIVVRRVLIGR